MATNLNDLIFIKRVKKAHHEQAHGGAWKIAYADFVTAMMAFFLLMWLLNATTEEQRTAISNYFAPASVSMNTSGAGGVLGGRTINEEGAMAGNRASPHVLLGIPTPTLANAKRATEEAKGEHESGGTLEKNELENATATDLGTVDENEAKDAKSAHLARADRDSGPDAKEGAASLPGTQSGLESEQSREARQQMARLANEEDDRFKQTAEALRQAFAEDPKLKRYQDNLRVEETGAGLRIQLLDDDKRAMFPLGSAELLDHTRELMAKVASIIKGLPNKIAIAGHTDATPYRTGSGYGNWELSTDRAHASRRALVAAGVDESHIVNVTGKAANDPLIKNDPEAPANRRISILLLRDTPPVNLFNEFGPRGDAPRVAAAMPEETPAAEPAGDAQPPGDDENRGMDADQDAASPPKAGEAQEDGAAQPPTQSAPPETPETGAKVDQPDVPSPAADLSGGDLWQRFN